jgi:hypothetical protein
MWSVVTFWDQTSGEFGAGTGRGLRVRVMVSFEESRGARWEVPFESVLRTLLVLAFVSLEIVSRVGFGRDGWTADGAIVVVAVSRRLSTI